VSVKTLSICIALLALGAPLHAEISQSCLLSLNGRSSTILVSSDQGGGYDAYARAIAPLIEDQAGMRVRVVNNSSGGGSVARQIAASADPEDLVVLVENMVPLAVERMGDISSPPILSALDTLGIMHVGNVAWITPDTLDLADPNLESLVASQRSYEDGVARTVLAGLSLGLDVVIVGGYGGTSDFVAAVLRGEVDMTAMSVETALKRTAGNSADLALILSDAPDAAAPEVPYLVGPGGLAEVRSRDFPADVSVERQRLAEAAMALSGAVRGIYISNQVLEPLRDCMREAYGEVLSSAELRRILQDQGRPIEPITGERAAERSTAMLGIIEESRSLLESLIASQTVD
jgi:tripartite-type tricarboxylate transporter receptor subunit TctC